MSRKNTPPWPDSEMFSGRPALSGEATTCARHSLNDFARLRQNGRRLAKRRQALRESNLPSNSQLETHRKAVGWGGLRLAPPTVFRPFDRFPHASKTRIVPPQAGSGRVRTDCRRFHGSYVLFDSDALQAGTGWHRANHGSIGDSRPTAFLGYPRGHRIDSETRCWTTAHRVSE